MSDRTTTAVACVAALLAFGMNAATGARQAKPGPAPLPAPLSVLWSQVVAGAQETPHLTAGVSLCFLNSAAMGLVARAPEDGRELWSSTYTSSLPAMTFGTRIAIASRGVLYVLDQETSVVVWQVDLPGEPASIFAAGDRIGAVIGQDLVTWSGSGAAIRTPLGAAAVTRVVFQNGVLYVGLAEPSLVAVDAATGSLRWRVHTPALAQSLTASDDLLYVGAADASIYFYRTTGAPKWAKRRHLVGARGEPAVDDRLVYFSLLDNTVRAFDRRGGAERWSRELGARPKSGPILMGSTLAVALENGEIAELTTGGTRLTAATPLKLAEARLQAVAATHDRSRFFTIATAKDESRILTAWTHPAPK